MSDEDEKKSTNQAPDGCKELHWLDMQTPSDERKGSDKDEE